MKSLQMNQMENIQGGIDFDTGVGLMCGVALVGSIATMGLTSAFAISLCAHGLLFMIK